MHLAWNCWRSQTHRRADAPRLRPILADVAPLVVVVVTFAAGCEGGYPLPPTECDDWCLATQRADCPEDRPEECVSECEQYSLIRQAPQCEPDWRTLLSCYQDADDSEFTCRYQESRPMDVLCLEERLDVAYCASRRFGLCTEACIHESLECEVSPLQCETFCLWTSEGCDRQHEALYECVLENPVHCRSPDNDPRSPEEMCLARIDDLLQCLDIDSL